MDNERYFILGQPAADGRVAVRRARDNRVSRCKPSWLKTDPAAAAGAGAMVASSRVKAIRLDGLEWKAEA